MPVELSADQAHIAAVARALRDEADGEELKKELGRNIRTAVAPAVTAVQSKVRALSGVPTEAKTAVASKIKVAIRYSGPSTAVKVAVSRTAARGFANAAKAFDAPSWRAPNPGGRSWHTQSSSAPGFWDAEMQRQANDAQAGVLAAVEAMAQRIARR